MDWDQFTKDTWELSQKIDYTPEIIVGITRGGVVPARLMATYLGVKEMHCLWVQRIGDVRKVASTLAVDLKDKKVLIVDDMMETSGVMNAARDHVASMGAVVKTACLYTMAHSANLPDYSFCEVKDVCTFPWENHFVEANINKI